MANGFAQKIVHAGQQAALACGLEGVGRERHDGHSRLGRVVHGTDGHGGGHAVHHRHVQVHQHGIEALTLQRQDRLLAIGCKGGNVAHAP